METAQRRLFIAVIVSAKACLAIHQDKPRTMEQWRVRSPVMCQRHRRHEPPPQQRPQGPWQPHAMCVPMAWPDRAVGPRMRVRDRGFRAQTLLLGQYHRLRPAVAHGLGNRLVAVDSQGWPCQLVTIGTTQRCDHLRLRAGW